MTIKRLQRLNKTLKTIRGLQNVAAEILRTRICKAFNCFKCAIGTPLNMQFAAAESTCVSGCKSDFKVCRGECKRS
jgi:hypothetical protein